MGVLSDCLKTILNAERSGKRQVIIHPISKIVIKFLKAMQAKGYIGEIEIIDDQRAKKAVVQLLGRINKCGVISPRYDIHMADMERTLSNLLPSRSIGTVLFTTTYGIMDQAQMRRKHTGGKVLGYFF